MQNLHVIMGSKFQHSKPNLCPFCNYNAPYGEWEGYCTVRNKILSVGNAKKGRCTDYGQKAANER